MRISLVFALFCGLIATTASAVGKPNLQAVKNAISIAKTAKKKQEDRRPWTAIARSYFEKNKKKGQSIKDFFIHAEQGTDKKKKVHKAKATVAKAKAATKSAAKAAKKAVKGDKAAANKAAKKAEKAKKTVAKVSKQVDKVKETSKRVPEHQKTATATAATAKKEVHKATAALTSRDKAIKSAVQRAATTAKAKLQALKGKMQALANSIIAMMKHKRDRSQMRLEDLRALAGHSLAFLKLKDGGLDMLLDSSYV